MKYYIDTEFIEYPGTIELISIGIVSEDDRKYYALSCEYNFHNAEPWVVQNVIIPIYQETDTEVGLNVFHIYYGKSLIRIREEIKKFIIDKPEFWGYYCDYDWVNFCWLFGKMIDLPAHYPKYCKDLKQLADETDKPMFAKSKTHSALDDAKWNKEFHKYLMEK